MMSTVTGHTAHSERPERSRNAKAQARHRAKRKAYIEQLEQTVTKLQTALGCTPEQLEQDNARLYKENEELRRLLSDGTSRGLSVEMTRRNSFATYQEARDRDYKRRKMSEMDGVYISPGDTPPHVNENIQVRPPPLNIPQQPMHHYPNTASSTPNHGGSPMFNLHAPAFQMPNTPSGSSATSSPPFSPAQTTIHPSSHQRPNSNPHSMPGYSNHYEAVKVEDDYPSNQSHNAHNAHYGVPPSYPSHDNAMDNWHAYSSERVQIHR
ncbi:hypothetical protein BDQ17DRAFT_1358891 [Cyathus striatus]|nr:hypothetical protein BDQ17DRAFT_1358891 [Cyathus striatus]